MSIIKLSPYIIDSTLDFTFNNVTATGNLTALNANLGNAASANYFIGNGSLLTGLPASYANANVANYLPTFAGNLTAGNISVSGDATITGNLTVSGTTTTINSTVVTVNDINIVLANNATTSAQANGAGITINGASANILYINSTNSFTFSHKISADGGLLSNIVGANVTGFVPNANVSNTAYSVAVANVVGIGNIATINKDGNASNILYGNGIFAAAPSGSGGSSTPTYTTITVDNFTGDGTSVTFLLSVTPSSKNQTSVNYNGALQLRSAYSISGANIVFSEAPANGSIIEVTTTIGVAQGAGNLTVRTYTGDNSTTTYTVSNGVDASSILVTQNGLLQTPATDYTVSSGVLTFATAPGTGEKIQVRELGTAIASISVPGSNTHVLFNNSGGLGASSSFTFDSSSNTLSATNISGNGSQLTALTGANVTGTVANATYAITSGVAGTVTTGAQPNITSTGTLTGLTVSGNVSLTGANISIGNVANFHIPGGFANWILSTNGSGNLSWIPQPTVGSGGNSNAAVIPGVTVSSFTANGNANSFTLSSTPAAKSQTMVHINGVYQTQSIYNLTGNVVSFGANVPSGAVVEVQIITPGTIANTVNDGAQPNITSVGILSNLSVSGNVVLQGANISLGAVANVKVTGGSNGQYISTDGSGNLSFNAIPDPIHPFLLAGM
jgi:hypothetical protein